MHSHHWEGRSRSDGGGPRYRAAPASLIATVPKTVWVGRERADERTGLELGRQSMSAQDYRLQRNGFVPPPTERNQDGMRSHLTNLSVPRQLKNSMLSRAFLCLLGSNRYDLLLKIFKN